jgi:hypothetical protein
MGGTPQGTIQVRRRGLVVARCGIGAADSFGMKQCPGGCPISGIAVLVDRQGLHGPVAADADHVAVLGTGRGTGVRGQVGRASTMCMELDVSIREQDQSRHLRTGCVTEPLCARVRSWSA